MRTTEIETSDQLTLFLEDPERRWDKVVVHSLDLKDFDNRMGAESLTVTTVFVGCEIGEKLAANAARNGCLLLSPREGLKFDPFRSKVYTWTDLLDRFDPANPDASYRACVDWLAYEAAMDENTKKKRVDLSLADELVFRLHDFFQEDALLDFLKPVPADVATWKKVVAIMGGHDLVRLEKLKDSAGDPTEKDSPYMEVARLAQRLTQEGYVIATGGGPGAMEAGNLGAFFAHRPEDELRAAVRKLQSVPKITPVAPNSVRWNSGEWLAPAVQILREFQSDSTKRHGESVGIPTWFYGHEPPNVFATHIAKYFENSLREEGLLAIGTHGVVFARGNAGTVQEIFQDACQNYYSTYGPPAPMVLLESAYWNRRSFGEVEAKAKPLWPLLQQLASERETQGFPRAILLTDSIETAIDHIAELDPARTTYLMEHNPFAKSS